jgi:two-component system OmpR family response regulator
MGQILVVEDDPHILRVISLWLTRQGHRVLEARSGLAAVKLLEVHAPDVLVTDINMPGMDGVELVERVAGQPRRPSGIVVLTNRWDHADIHRRLARWGAHVLPKPFSPSKLSELIHRLVRSPEAAAGAAPEEQVG